MKISQLVSDARIILRDNFGYGAQSFTDPELVGYCNRAMDFCADVSASCNPVTKALSLSSGTIQKLPANGGRVLGFLHNDLESNKRYKVGVMSYKGKAAAREMDMDSLVAQNPNWASVPASPLVVYVMFDPLSPKEFVVYPANDGTGKLFVRFTERPVPVATVADDFPLSAEFKEACVNLIMYFALTRDGEDTENSARAKDFYQQATMLLFGFDGLKMTLSGRSTMRK